MKRLAFFILITFSVASQAQDLLGNRTYRVTAYKKGDNKIVSVSNYADVTSPVNIYIPNAFTPNDDGINDTFGIKGEGLANYHILLFNRWGEVIFDSKNPYEHWDGKFNGQPVESGVYAYEVTAQGFGKHPKTGSVTLVR